MAYPEIMKQRALELSMRHRNANVILNILEDEFEDTPFNEKTIRRWIKTNSEEKRTVKFNHDKFILDIIKMLLDSKVAKVFNYPLEGHNSKNFKYSVISKDSSADETITHGMLVERIENNIENIVRKYSAWEFWECFLSHLEAEFPESKDFPNYYNNKPIEFINSLRILSRRKTFKGSCPMCKG